LGYEAVKLKQVYLTAADPEALAEFYKALGLTLRFADQGKWIQFEGEKTAFCVASSSESVSKPSGNAVLVFEVEDLEPVLEAAREQGADVSDDIREMGAHGRVAHFKDPQHNIVQLLQAARKGQ
jgi:predicted enzyme related to lactoylglutathione lyase